jgi:hypothetical protein
LMICMPWITKTSLTHYFLPTFQHELNISNESIDK